MPRYTYSCDDCGPFDAWATMSQAEEPACCPACSGAARREMAMPHVSTLNPRLRTAIARTEKTSSEPKVVSREHLAGCGCSLCATRKKKPQPIERRWSLGH
ncbi:FmdB family zinc ribbon protein [Xanthobacter autotrophicus DSM 431]|uniref:FmdB family zinc ribbon protein n=1 Tax=Xanthobacter nonsaccharivorans TaxID=3119912 RepID=UPI0037286F8A